ncbi:MAG: hypothetical protein QM729_05615 [Solirubrobacterales bacterium]
MSLASRAPRRWFAPHLPRRTVRLRLTLLYGGLFLLSGAALSGITYGLVAHVSDDVLYGGVQVRVKQPKSGKPEVKVGQVSGEGEVVESVALPPQLKARKKKRPPSPDRLPPSAATNVTSCWSSRRSRWR